MSSFNFQIFEDSGNDPIKHFSVRLTINKKAVSKGRGPSKKKAEEQAAKRAFFALQEKIDA